MRIEQALGIAAVAALAGCGGGASGAEDAGSDSSLPDAERRDAGPPDAGPADADPSDGGGAADGGLPACITGAPGELPWEGPLGATVTITGDVYVEGAPDRRPDAGVASLDAGGAVTPGGRIVGATVRVRELVTGRVMRTAITDGRGHYEIEAPAGDRVWLEVVAVPGYVGVLRLENVRATDYPAYDMVLPSRAGAEATAEGVGVAYDPARGTIAVGFNPITPDRGGEGADLGCTDHAPAANLVAGGAIASNVLVPRCGAGGFDAGVCTDAERSNQIHFQGVAPGWTRIDVLSPPAGTCALRVPVDLWLVLSDTFTAVNVDCR